MGKMDNKTLNEMAAVLHNNLSERDYSFMSCPDEFYTVYNFTFNYFKKKYNDKYQEVFGVSFLKAIKAFSPNAGSFISLLKKIVYREWTDQYNSDMKQRRKKVGETIDENGEKHNEYIYFEEIDKGFEDEEGNESYFEIDDKNEYLERKVHTRSQLERVYLILADLSIEKQREYSEKKTFCYPPLFFTDMITVLQRNAAVTDFINENQQKLDDAVEFPFANHYLVRECSSVCDFRDNPYKPLSEFTGKESDEECGNPKAGSFLWLDYNVYITYVLKTTGKAVSASNISDQSKKFAGLMRDTLKKKGETLSE